MNIKRRLAGGKWKSFVVGEFDKLEDYFKADRTKRQINGRNNYKIFDEVLKKVSGSEDPETHRNFLDARFTSINQKKPRFKPLIEKPSWKTFSLMIDEVIPKKKSPTRNYQANRRR